MIIFFDLDLSRTNYNYMKTKEQKNSDIFLRPRFSIDCNKPVNDILQAFHMFLDSDNCLYKSKISNDHIFIDIPDDDSHFWSPQLHIQIVQEDSVTKIKGLFGPKPQVWTLFMFIHFLVATTFIGFAIMLYVKIRLNETVFFPAVMLVSLPIIWFVLYFLGRIGKETGSKQMNDLKHFMQRILQTIN